MAGANPIFIIEDVEALYPKLDQPYRYDKKKGVKGLTVPCDATDDNAAYEMSIRMPKEKAVPLYKAMKAAYENKKAANWPDMPKSDAVFEIDDDGMYTAKTKLKAKFDKDLVDPPKQFDANNVPLAKDFLLTTGSTVNCLLSLVPYSNTSMGDGVSLRLRQVQVTKLAVMKERSAFSAVEGGYCQSEGFATSFETAADTAEEDDDGAAPAVAAVPDAPKPKPQPEAKAEPKKVETNDIDNELANLEFDD